MNNDKFIKFVQGSKKTHGWKRIQWQTVTKEYLTRLKRPADENTKKLREKLKIRYHKNKAKVVAQEKVVDYKGRPLKVGDVVKYIGDEGDDELDDEEESDKEGDITAIKDGVIKGIWRGIVGLDEEVRFNPDYIEKILSKEERADEIRSVLSGSGDTRDQLGHLFRVNKLRLENDLSITDTMTNKQLVVHFDSTAKKADAESNKKWYYNYIVDKLFGAKTVEQYEDAIAAGAHVGMLHRGRNVFIRACQRGSKCKLIQHILNAHPGLLNSVDKDNETGLSWAVYCGNIVTVKKLLRYPHLEVNHKSRYGRTAFMDAFLTTAKFLSMDAARVLLTDKRTEGIVSRTQFVNLNIIPNVRELSDLLRPTGANTQGPISLETPIKIPVRCLTCRNLFEATELHAHLQVNNSCPMCRNPMNTLEFLTDFQIRRWNRMKAIEQNGESRLAAARKEMAAAQKTIDENTLKNRFRQFVVKEYS